MQLYIKDKRLKIFPWLLRKISVFIYSLSWNIKKFVLNIRGVLYNFLTYFEFFGGLDNGIGYFFHIVLVLIVDWLAD